MSDPGAPSRVIITGGHGALGRALSSAFQAQGAEVEAPGRAEMDVTAEAMVNTFFARQTRVDVLVANAGRVRDGAVTALGTADFDEVIQVNLRGAFLCCRAALKPMLAQRRGHLLLIGSRAARAGTRGQSVYAAAKAGLVAFGQSLAREYGPRNIRCNIVLPGFLETPMTAAVSAERREEVRREHALGRFNTPENAARFIAFLAGLDHVSGQVFTLDSRIDRWT